MRKKRKYHHRVNMNLRVKRIMDAVPKDGRNYSVTDVARMIDCPYHSVRRAFELIETIINVRHKIKISKGSSRRKIMFISFEPKRDISPEEKMSLMRRIEAEFKQFYEEE